MIKRLAFTCLSLTLAICPLHAAPEKPNIVVILADDLGYGDVSCLNPDLGKIPTPHIDRLASEGITFTDAHSSSSVCTPTRYSLLTGRYNWRTRLQRSVLLGFSEPLIAPGRLTVAALLQSRGYRTACFGKWHLGLTLPTTDGKPQQRDGANIDWKGTLSNSPVHHGFDHFFGISASLDMPPYIYIQNDRFVGECTTTKTFLREGPAEADFEAVDVLPTIGTKAAGFIASQKPGTPFFAYIALTSPHTPIVPSPEWQGKNEVGPYGDFTMQTDAVIGKIIQAVDDAGFRENTLVIVTSDNGCSRDAGITDLLARGHHPSARFRGSKADLWDGGHRIPFIARWPRTVKPGTSCSRTICQTDLMATCAELAGTTVPETAGEDSVSFAPALAGMPIPATRQGIIHHSISGHFAYRQDQWKLLLARGSAGWTAPAEAQAIKDGAPAAQLYDLENDPGETNNLYASQPEIADRLLKQLEADIKRGRSTPGPDTTNDIDQIELWKSGQ